ncbi:hypothetical protein Salat_2517500 [Sesamum alatum]|uniref:Transposase (putative) gypsy type domain-containing protein n=1 Tax=Sesamum alatum TaxID=300844 RepID=A0AAE1XS06_9LAMI|nr:hypothetical protein Salat_2517500 [Sesamum alatum]
MSSESSESSGSSNSSSDSSNSSLSSKSSSSMAGGDAPNTETPAAPEVVDLEVAPGVPASHNVPLDARLFVRSCIKYKDLPKIRREYHILEDYTLLIPTNDQSMHQPPPNCLTVHLPLLDAGLRFPIEPRVATLINHLFLSPSQLVPNALRNILCFVILVQYFGYEPLVQNFSALFIASSSTRS